MHRADAVGLDVRDVVCRLCHVGAGAISAIDARRTRIAWLAVRAEWAHGRPTGDLASRTCAAPVVSYPPLAPVPPLAVIHYELCAVLRWMGIRTVLGSMR